MIHGSRRQPVLVGILMSTRGGVFLEGGCRRSSDGEDD